MKNLYQIEKQYLELAENLIESGGELTPDLIDALEINQNELEIKGRNYGFVIKDIENQNDLIDAEIKRLQALKISRTKAIDFLRSKLSAAMQLFGIEKIETPLLKISFRNSESIEVENPELLEDIYKVEKKTYIPDKSLIKQSIKSGINVTGAILRQNKNLQIK